MRTVTELMVTSLEALRVQESLRHIMACIVVVLQDPFSTVGFVYVNGPQPTPENPLIWYLVSSTVYDVRLDSKVAPDSVVNGIAEAKSIASTVNKAEASAVMAQTCKQL